MPPKKNIVSQNPTTSKKTPEKKPRVKQFKAKLKSPTVIKIKIPHGGVTMCKNKMSPKRIRKPTKKQLALDKKSQERLDLANEVAMAQLVKSKAVVFDSEPLQNEKPKLPKKRRQKRKIEETSSSDSDGKKVRKVPAKDLKKKPATAKATDVKNSSQLRKKILKVTKNSDVDVGTKPPKKVIKASKKKIACKPPDTEFKTKKGKTNIDADPIDNIQSSKKIEVKVPPEPTSVGNIEPGRIESRKTSVNSELSWTKDISSSSTTTCLTVCSTDFVLIDNKIPVVKLDNIGLKSRLKRTNNFPSSSSESSTKKQVDNANRESSPEMERRSLVLSTSSITPTKSISSVPSRKNNVRNSAINDEIDNTTKALDKLVSKLQKFDLEIINWIGYENEEISDDMMRFRGKIMQVLKEESEVIEHCQRLKKVLSNNDPLDDVNDDIINAKVHRQDLSYDINKPNETVARKDNGRNIVPCSPKQYNNYENDFTSDNVKFKSFDENYDDDDALSLFAESITCIDPSTRNSCSASIHNVEEVEEYIPKALDNPTFIEPAQRISYTPSIIFNNDKINETRIKTVCEKQNADSTSIKDTEQERHNSTSTETPNRPPMNNIPIATIKNNINLSKKQPGLISSRYTQPSGMRSVVLRGVCFFNLLSSCKNKNNLECRFKHEFPSPYEITAKLFRLSEQLVIEEYMLFREWPILRRKYGMCFFEECQRRDLTRILVEMAIDFTIKAVPSIKEDMKLKLHVVELVLLHLNSVELETCEDLLTYKVYQVPLSDIFMQTIANTQNFSRFKPVFIKMTHFILGHHRTFNFYVATQILERLSILPCEKPLLEALLQIVKNTDRKILDNAMVAHFEQKLLVYNELYDQLVELKNGGAVERPVPNQYESPRLNSEIEPPTGSSLVAVEREQIYTSPDTTNLDNMQNKTTKEPVATPTVEFHRTNIFGTINRTFSTNSPNKIEEYRPRVVTNCPYKRWRDQSIFNNIRAMTPVLMHAPRPMRPVHQMGGYGPIGPNPPIFLRRPGPDYY